MENRFEHIEEIIAKYLAGEAEAREIALLNEWKSLSESNRREFEQFNKLFSESSALKHSIPVDTDRAWKRVQESINKANHGNIISIKSKPLQNYILKIAASIILIAGLSFAIFKLNYNSEENLYSVSTQDSIKTELLPDGSSITLNRKSTLAYSTDHFSKKRIVKLKGEAFFDVVHDESKPFIVEASDLKIEDIGTSFNIKAIEGSEMVIVSVVTGEVKITSIDKQPVFLSAGEEATYNVHSKVISKMELISPNISAYANRVFIFENTELTTVMKVLNEVYDVKLGSENDTILKCRITVTFDDESIDEISEVIAETLGLGTRKENNKIIFIGNACKQ